MGYQMAFVFNNFQRWSRVQLFQSRKNIRYFRRPNKYHDTQLKYATFCNCITPLRTSQDHYLPVSTLKNF